MVNLDKKEKGITLLDDELLRINEYINSLKSKNKYQFLYNISKFIDSYDFEDVLTIIKEILNNDKLNDVLNSLVNDNKINIIDLREDYKTNTFISIISVYCDFNNIELVSDNYDYNEEFLNQSIDDTTRLYLKEMSKYPLLTMDEEKELFLKFKSGDEKAREKITNSNLRLVLSVAKKYVNRGLPFLDLVQEGNLGLMKSIDKYDVEKGFKFSTYATWWIRQGITRAIGDYGNTIRIPIHVLEKSNKLEKVINSLKISLGQEPTVEEISKEMNCSTEMVLKLLEVLENRNLVSLNSFVNEEEDTELINLVPDKENALEEEIIKDLSKTEILNLIDKAKLKDKEKEVLYFRFGILDDKPLTLKKVSEKYDVTCERIWQIEAKTLRKLRPYLRKIVDAENFKSKNNNESFIIYLNEFEKCKILDKFDPSKIGFKFLDNTSMSDWFYDNLTELLDSKNIRYKLIQTQYETYKKTKEEERKEKEKIKREKSFSKLNEFELGKRIIISKNNKGNISTNKTYRPAKKENENYDADLNIKEQKHTINEKKWLENYELAKKYYEENGDLLVSFRYKVNYNNKIYNLGTWIGTQRNEYRLGKLSDKRINLLNKIGMVWNVKEFKKENIEEKWLFNYNLAKDYFNKFGNLLIPFSYEIIIDGKIYRLGHWIHNQRKAYWGYYGYRLTTIQIDMLNEIGMQWQLKSNKKEENYYDDKKTSGVDEKTDFSLKESNNTKIKGELQMKNEETGKQIRDTNEFYSMFNGNVQDVDYIIENLISEKQKDEIRVGFYLEFPYYKVEDINKAFNMLSKNQQSAVLKRHDGDLSNPKNTKRGLLNKSEQNLYWIAKNTIVNKIENGFEEKKLGRPKLADKNKNNETKNEVVEKNELPDIVKNAKTEEKSRKIKFDDNEAYLKLYELFNMPYFLYALSKLDPRDYKVLFLKLNYPEKSLEEIASFSGCSKEQLINSFNNAASTLKEVVDTLIDEAFKISDSEIKSENSYKIG